MALLMCQTLHNILVKTTSSDKITTAELTIEQGVALTGRNRTVSCHAVSAVDHPRTLQNTPGMPTDLTDRRQHAKQ